MSLIRDTFSYISDYQVLMAKEAELDEQKKKLEDDFRNNHSRWIPKVLMIGIIAGTAVGPVIRMVGKH